MELPTGLTRPPIELLRFSTAGSVDDGKSTLIGRLLFESKAIYEDQLLAIEHASRDQGLDDLNLALLTDGLRAEREQGITIDVAYRYFSTPRRSFILADTPGHVQYTRNMVTGASNADLTIVLVDASRGVSEQSRRHLFLAALLGIRHIVVCVNKMDLVDYAPAAFDSIQAELARFLDRLGIPDLVFIPISALRGDNVVERATTMPWYLGPSLLEHLESVEVAAELAIGARFPVQWVMRPDPRDPTSRRGYAGRVAAGTLRPGDDVVVLPAGLPTRIRAIRTHDGSLAEAFAPMSVVVEIDDEIDISRGDLLASPDDRPLVANRLDATVCWLAGAPLTPGRRFALKHTTRASRAVVDRIDFRVDVNTLDRHAAAALHLNDIGQVAIRTTAPLVIDPYRRSRATGAFILIDEATNETAGAGLIVGVAE